jgi:hypothetical protein
MLRLQPLTVGVCEELWVAAEEMHLEVVDAAAAAHLDLLGRVEAEATVAHALFLVAFRVLEEESAVDYCVLLVGIVRELPSTVPGRDVWHHFAFAIADRRRKHGSN